MNPTVGIGILLCGCLAAFAQGPININNFIDGVTRPINFPSSGHYRGGYFTGAGVLGAGWVAEFVAADGTPIGQPVPFRSAGRLDGRAPNDLNRIVTGTPGVAQNITVRVWDTVVFPTWAEAAQALFRGNTVNAEFTAAGSSTFVYTIPLGNPPPIGADRILNFTSFGLTFLPGGNCVPEPSTYALGVLGIVVLFWRTRR